MSAPDMLAAALAYGDAGWKILPLAGKVPAIPGAHPDGDPLRGRCKGECGRDGHGVLDATSDPGKIGRWLREYPRANIGGRVPAGALVTDVDPRHGGDRTLAALTREHGPLPVTLTCISGRGDGGRHLHFRHPGGKVTATLLGPGIDVKTAAGYVVLPPSLHPVTGRPYRWQDPGAPIAAAPPWLVALLRGPVRELAPAAPRRARTDGESIADWFSDSATWAEVLQPHGWRCVNASGDDDGAVWLHPAATSTCSATVRHGLLFVYSTNTPFIQTEAGDPHGYTRFRAYAILDHDGDLTAAARSAADVRGGQR